MERIRDGLRWDKTVELTWQALLSILGA